MFGNRNYYRNLSVVVNWIGVVVNSDWYCWNCCG